ncbi:hypothetical protein BBJ28_00013557 [Nothophytophthora sp. Chile5]|nr:hypothetical protein BBJ28_00013557 [Nothophytophthora sp. Chile5]
MLGALFEIASALYELSTVVTDVILNYEYINRNWVEEYIMSIVFLVFNGVVMGFVGLGIESVHPNRYSSCTPLNKLLAFLLGLFQMRVFTETLYSVRANVQSKSRQKPTATAYTNSLATTAGVDQSTSVGADSHTHAVGGCTSADLERDDLIQRAVQLGHGLMYVTFIQVIVRDVPLFVLQANATIHYRKWKFIDLFTVASTLLTLMRGTAAYIAKEDKRTVKLLAFVFLVGQFVFRLGAILLVAMTKGYVIVAYGLTITMFAILSTAEMRLAHPSRRYSDQLPRALVFFPFFTLFVVDGSKLTARYGSAVAALHSKKLLKLHLWRCVENVVGIVLAVFLPRYNEEVGLVRDLGKIPALQHGKRPAAGKARGSVAKKPKGGGSSTVDKEQQLLRGKRVLLVPIGSDVSRKRLAIWQDLVGKLGGSVVHMDWKTGSKAVPRAGISSAATVDWSAVDLVIASAQLEQEKTAAFFHLATFPPANVPVYTPEWLAYLLREKKQPPAEAKLKWSEQLAAREEDKIKTHRLEEEAQRLADQEQQEVDENSESEEDEGSNRNNSDTKEIQRAPPVHLNTENIRQEEKELEIKKVKLMQERKAIFYKNNPGFRPIGERAKVISSLKVLRHRVSSVKDLKSLHWAKGRLRDKVIEILETGHLSKLEAKKSNPRLCALVTMARIWGVGPATAAKLYNSGYRSLDDLRNPETSAVLTAQQQIGLKHYQDFLTKIPRYDFAMDLPYRRLDIKVYPRRFFGFAMLYFTGSDHFNRSMRLFAHKNGWSLSDRALQRVMRVNGMTVQQGESVICESEVDVFIALGLEYKDPTERNCFDIRFLDEDEANAKRGSKSAARGDGDVE